MMASVLNMQRKHSYTTWQFCVILFTSIEKSVALVSTFFA